MRPVPRKAIFMSPSVPDIFNSSEGLPAMCSSQRRSGKGWRSLLVSCVDRRVKYMRLLRYDS